MHLISLYERIIIGNVIRNTTPVKGNAVQRRANREVYYRMESLRMDQLNYDKHTSHKGLTHGHPEQRQNSDSHTQPHTHTNTYTQLTQFPHRVDKSTSEQP